jgi:hypothetical protein
LSGISLTVCDLDDLTSPSWYVDENPTFSGTVYLYIDTRAKISRYNHEALPAQVGRGLKFKVAFTHHFVNSCPV